LQLTFNLTTMKACFIITTMAISLSSFCQIDKGTIILSGDIGFDNNSYEEKSSGTVVYSAENSSFSFNPKVGIFVSQNIALGLGIGILNSEQSRIQRFNFGSPEQRTSSEISSLYVNPFINFQSRITDKLQLNVGLESRIGRGDTKYSNSNNANTEGEINFFEFNLIPGLYYFVSKKTALTLNYGSFTYGKSTETVDRSSLGSSDYEIESKDIGFNFGLNSFRIGFVFVFAKKTE
jgi:hypothetical protein